MHADAKLDAPILRHAGVALDQALLHFDGAAHRVDHAAEFDDDPVASALDDAAVVGGDGGVDEVAAKTPKTRQRAVLVRPGEPAIADDIGDQDRRELASRSFFREPCLAQAVEQVRDRRGERGQPFDAGQFGLQAPGFRQGRVRIVHFAGERIGGG